jgi:hypothetical protein
MQLVFALRRTVLLLFCILAAPMHAQEKGVAWGSYCTSSNPAYDPSELAAVHYEGY